MRDLTGEFGRVGPTDQQVPGVQAERYLRSLQDPLHVVAGFDHGSDVRVQHGAHAVLGGPGGDAIQVPQQQGPAVGVQFRPAVVAVEAGNR